MIGMTTTTGKLSETQAREHATAFLSRIAVCYLSHGFYQITANRAGRICRAFNGVPRHGYERLVAADGVKYWIGRTPHQGGMVWSARFAGVDAIDGQVAR